MGCASPAPRAVDYDTLAGELIAMRDEDQRLNQLVVDRAAEALEEGFADRKQRTYESNTAHIAEVFDQMGYPDPERVGSEASRAFWLLVQHSDSDPAFQERVIEAMRPLVVEGRVDSDSLALLTDRVRVNTGRPQVYGSQVDFDMEVGRAYPKPLEAPATVDRRRTEVGLVPLWEYMNDMSEFNFMMNEDHYAKLGVKSAWSYPEGFQDW